MSLAALRHSRCGVTPVVVLVVVLMSGLAPACSGGGKAVVPASTTPPPATRPSTTPPPVSVPTGGQPAGQPGAPAYLALGDSVPFGYRPPQVTSPLEYLDAANFSGYPDQVAAALHLAVTDAACPGETVASMISASAPSNGCQGAPGLPAGYRTVFPLHVAYNGSQLDFAVGFLRGHPDTRLVTVTVGANDVFLCEHAHGGTCAGRDLALVLDEVGRDLTTVLSAIRQQAGYRGPLVFVSYYPVDTAPAAVAATRALDDVLAAPVRRFGGMVADGYRAFRDAATADNGDPCRAGLLIRLPSGACDVHPSAVGQQALARAVVRVVGISP